MAIKIARSFGWTLLVSLVLLVDASAGEQRLLATDADRVAIQGYDTVAYFTDGKAVKGSSNYEYVRDDAKWYFVSAAHRDLFVAEPERYMPQFGGYCAGALMDGILVPANPKAWAIVGGKLYMIAGESKDIDEWKVNAAANVEKANQNLSAVKALRAQQQ